MIFALNFSHQAAALLAKGRINIDRFKTPNWPHLVAAARAYRPVAVHFNLQAGQEGVQDADWEQIRQLLEQTGTPYINLHLSPSLEYYPGFTAGHLSPAQTEHVFKRMLQDVRIVAERFGPDRVIVENVPYRGEDGEILRAAVEPGIIRRILDETGCGLLLDISHARIAARHLEMDALQYMSSLPVDRLREMHFTGLHCVDRRLQDHLPVLDQDWQVLDWVLEQIRTRRWAQPWMLVFEYGGVGGHFENRSDPAVIAAQVPRLYELASVV